MAAAAEPQGAAVPEPEGYWTGPVNDPVPRTIRGGKVIDAQAAATLLEEGHAVFIDVSNAPRRPEPLAPEAPWLPPPHLGIPGAHWIAGVGLGNLPAPLEQFFRERLAALTGNDLTRPLVIYCHERCWLSWNGAKRAISYGYRRVYWFPDGIEGWRASHRPVSIVKPEEIPTGQDWSANRA